MTDSDSISTTMALEGIDDSRQALLDMLTGMRRTLFLYTPLVRSELYDDSEVVDALRERVVNQPKLRFHLILPPAREWRDGCPRLSRLSERLTTALVLRIVNRNEIPNRPELLQAFAIADGRTLLHFNDPRRLLGSYAPKPTERTKELSELFQFLWDRAQPDPALSRLGL